MHLWDVWPCRRLGLGIIQGVDCDMASRSLILSASMALFLTGCAWGPGVETTPAALPPSAPTYRLIEAEPTNALTLAAEGAVRRHMEARGWREVRDAPAWRVEVAYSARPQKVGSYSDASARESEWLAGPNVPQWWGRKRMVHSLTVILNGPGDSPTAYRATAAVKMRDRAPEATIDRLAQAVATDLLPSV